MQRIISHRLPHCSINPLSSAGAWLSREIDHHRATDPPQQHRFGNRRDHRIGKRRRAQIAAAAVTVNNRRTGGRIDMQHSATASS